ncbi:MAG TPA: hypothetical protein VKS25_03895 [Solirubrobacteraceae bacterium]|nr:hypothetical protein [Solirubrobacteraceae bacterium]
MADLPDPFLSFGESAKVVAPTQAVYVPQRMRADWFSHAITIIGLVFIGVAVYSLVEDTKLISLGYLDIKSSSATVTLEIIYVGIGAGLIARRELIRELCIVLAMIAVVAAGYGTYSYVRQDNIDEPAALAATAKAQSRATVLEADLTKATAQNSAAPSAQADAEIASLTTDEAAVQAQVQTDADGERWDFSGLILAWVLAVVPLVLLTRSKAVARFT